MAEKENGAVLKLQEMALDNSVDIAEALRAAYMIASKLNLTEFRQWADRELNGYKGVRDEEIPNYRIMHVQIKAKNPFHGMIPVFIQDEELREPLTNTFVRDSIGSLLAILDAPDNKHIVFLMPFEAQQFINKLCGTHDLEIMQIASKNQVQSLVDRVRTFLLDFALSLEKNGIIGSEISFSEREKKQASSMGKQIYIDNFQGILGDVSNSSISQSFNTAINKQDFLSLKNYLLEQNVPEADIEELHQSISNDSLPDGARSFGKNVASWIGKMISKAATEAWNVSISAAGGVLEEALKEYYGLS